MMPMSLVMTKMQMKANVQCYDYVFYTLAQNSEQIPNAYIHHNLQLALAPQEAYGGVFYKGDSYLILKVRNLSFIFIDF